jgi:hypothetical protein
MGKDMNKRIKKLAEQAGWMMGDEVEGFNTRLEKFAELIVRECINKCKTDWYGDSLDDICVQMLEHFGVKE